MAAAVSLCTCTCKPTRLTKRIEVLRCGATMSTPSLFDSASVLARLQLCSVLLWPAEDGSTPRDFKRTGHGALNSTAALRVEVQVIAQQRLWSAPKALGTPQKLFAKVHNVPTSCFAPCFNRSQFACRAHCTVVHVTLTSRPGFCTCCCVCSRCATVAIPPARSETPHGQTRAACDHVGASAPYTNNEVRSTRGASLRSSRPRSASADRGELPFEPGPHSWL